MLRYIFHTGNTSYYPHNSRADCFPYHSYSQPIDYQVRKEHKGPSLFVYVVL